VRGLVRLTRFNGPPGLGSSLTSLSSLNSSGSLWNVAGKIRPRSELCLSPREALRKVARQIWGVPYLSKN